MLCYISSAERFASCGALNRHTNSASVLRALVLSYFSKVSARIMYNRNLGTNPNRHTKIPLAYTFTSIFSS
jgi:hypothetical protein